MFCPLWCATCALLLARSRRSHFVSSPPALLAFPSRSTHKHRCLHDVKRDALVSHVLCCFVPSAGDTSRYVVSVLLTVCDCKPQLMLPIGVFCADAPSPAHWIKLLC
ncbi:hypothetical protein TRVL_06688 [Trypanosoma vivax]|nr:hypothetical protein TRVL_06688 [Trypanosoma vivax]